MISKYSRYNHIGKKGVRYDRLINSGDISGVYFSWPS